MDFDQRKNKICELAKMISLHSFIPKKKAAEINQVQDRLEFKLRELEEKAMDLKITAMEKVLTIIHGTKQINN